jgi:hypothetical protein
VLVVAAREPTCAELALDVDVTEPPVTARVET